MTNLPSKGRAGAVAGALAFTLLLASPAVVAQPRRSTTPSLPNAPRLLAPGSGTTVAGRRPTFHWTTPRNSAPGPYTWQVCRDRACTQVIARATASSGSTWPSQDLPPGLLYWCVGSANGNSSAVWEVVIPPRGASDGTQWGRVTDVNGDGYADVLRLAPPGSNDARRAFLHVGSPQGVSGARVPIGAGTAGVVGDAGDVNGDGFSDVAVAPAGGALAVRTVALYLGGASGMSASASTALRLALPRGGPVLSVEGAGDCDGDGYGDVLVAQGTQASGGDDRIMVFFGGASAVRATTLSTTSTNAAVPIPGESFAAPLGDINGDGFSDVAVRTTVNDGRATGAVAVFLGGTSGFDTGAPVRLLPGTGDDAEVLSFGQGISSAGDVNGDGYPEIAVGSATCVWLFAGSSAGPVLPAVFTRCSQPSPTGDLINPDLSGRHLAAGDFNGDGFGDLLVGDEGAGPDASGYAYVFAGSAQGFGAQPSWRLEPGQPDVADFGYGSGYRAPGDINGDGLADVVAISSGYSPVELFSGRTPSAVFYGSGNGPGPTPGAWLP